MSKIIKSEQCVETHPRQLPPLDVDSFFIIEEEERRALFEENISEEQGALKSSDQDETTDDKNATLPTGDEARPADESKTEVPSLSAGDEKKIFEDDDNDDEIVVNINQNDRNRLAMALMDYQENLEQKAKLPMRSEKKWIPQSAVKSENNTNKPAIGAVNLDHIADVAATLEALLSVGKTEATPSEKAPTTPEKNELKKEPSVRSLYQRANKDFIDEEQPIDKMLHNVKQKAIIEEAEHQADTIIHNTKDQADLILEGARQTAEKSIEKSKLQAEQAIADANQEAAKVLEETNQKIADMLEEANNQTAAIKDEAYQEGLTAGREAALVAAKQELVDNFDQALRLIGEIESERVERIGSSEPELLKLAVKIAEKIIGEEIQLDPNRKVQIVREALSKASTADSIILRIHPDDLQLIRDNLAVLQSAFTSPKPVEIREDLSIPVGSCFIETDRGNLDARVQSQLEQIMNELLKVGKIQ